MAAFYRLIVPTAMLLPLQKGGLFCLIIPT